MLKTFTRQQLHEILDSILDGYGYGDEINLGFGKLMVAVQMENGKPVLYVNERETRREL